MDDEVKDKKEYEFGFLADDEADLAYVSKELKGHGGEVTFESPMQKIRLAYPIMKRDSAYFGYVYFNADPSAVPGIEAGFRLDKKIIRFLLVSPIKSSRTTSGGAGRRSTRPSDTPPIPPKEVELRERERVAERPQGLSNEALEKTLEEILK